MERIIDSPYLKKRFHETFATAPQLLAKSPGRINLIGEHTDYNEGFVLPTAIDKAVYVALSKRDDNLIRLYAADFDETVEVELSTVVPSAITWSNYILGVVDQMQKKGLALSGFNLYMQGDVPLGAGLSSSAAVECATGSALNELFDLKLGRQEIAQIGQLAEHSFAGVKCGIMDQFASVLSKKGHVIKLDCRDLSYEYVPLDLGAYEIVLFNTNVKHSLASSAYNDRRASCEKGVAWVAERYPQVNSLRDVTIGMLDKLVKVRDDDTYRKCRYVVEENARLQHACDALQGGDIAELGRQMFATHKALSRDYEVSCPELDFLVKEVKVVKEVLGARMMGGGFGGCTINIVRKGYGSAIASRLAPAYREQFGLDLDVIYVQADSGSTLLE